MVCDEVELLACFVVVNGLPNRPAVMMAFPRDAADAPAIDEVGALQVCSLRSTLSTHYLLPLVAFRL